MPEPTLEPLPEKEMSEWAFALARLRLDGELPSEHLDLIARLIAEIRRLRPMLQDAEEKQAQGVAEVARLRTWLEKIRSLPRHNFCTSPHEEMAARVLEDRSDG